MADYDLLIEKVDGDVIRSVAKMPGSNSDSSWLSSHVLYCGTVTVYQCYMACFITVTGRSIVGCNSGHALPGNLIDYTRACLLTNTVSG